jgi:hypothetical protein
MMEEEADEEVREHAGLTRTEDTALACSNHRTGVRYFAVPVVNPIHLEDSLSQTGSGIGGSKVASHQSI